MEHASDILRVMLPEGAMILECSDRIPIVPYDSDLTGLIDGNWDTVEEYDELLLGSLRDLLGILSRSQSQAF